MGSQNPQLRLSSSSGRNRRHFCQGKRPTAKEFAFENQIKNRMETLRQSRDFPPDKLMNLTDTCNGIHCSKFAYEATKQYRKLLCDDDTGEARRTIIDSNLIPRLVEFIAKDDDQHLQFEATWILAIMTSGSNLEIKAIVENGAVPGLVKLLASPLEDVQEQALIALRNITLVCPRYRDLVLIENPVQVMMYKFDKNGKLSKSKQVARALAAFSAGRPAPVFVLLQEALPCLAHLLLSSDEMVRTYACNAISNLSEGKSQKIQFLIDSNVCIRLLELMKDSSLVVPFSVLDTVCKILSNGSSEQIIYMVENGCIPAFCNLLTSIDSRVICVALDALDSILVAIPTVSWSNYTTTFSAVNHHAELVTNSGGYSHLQSLTSHDNQSVSEKASTLLESYWRADD